MNFKKVPIITFLGQDDDRELGDGPTDAHYKLELKNIVMGPIEEQVRDEDDGYDTFITKDDEVPGDEELLQGLVTKKDFTGVKTIHFDDSCKVPRFKLGELCGKQGIRVIRDRDKADAVIYGSSFTKSVFNTTGTDTFNYKADFISQAKKVKCKRNLAEIIPLLEACDSNIVLLDSFDTGNGQENKLCVQKRAKKDDSVCFDLTYTEIADESKYLLLTGNNNLIHQDLVLENLSSVVIDEEMFNSICKMLESEDESNHLVAMEVMSNTAYRSSIVYLLELMRRHWGEKLNNLHERKNISFKALMEYLNYSPGSDERSFDDFINVVINKKALTESNYKLILKLILEEEHKCMKDEESRWKITSIDLDPKYKDKVIWDKVEEPILTEAL